MGLIALDGLTKTFSHRAVLDELTLSIDAGDRIALIGSNGAGKTTLFRCLLGHYRYQGGISFDGAKSGRRDAALLRQVAFVPQLPPPLRMSVKELLSFAANGAGADRGQMAEIAEHLGIDLEEVGNQLFHRLSGGQKQKILVTIALARDARLLIFDEPAANLDPAARAVFIDLLAARKDASMLIASHRLEEVAPLVNRVIELDRGKLALDDGMIDRLQAGVFRACRIGMSEPHQPFIAALKNWGFEPVNSTLYEGQVAAGDTLRLLGLLSRYASVIERLSLLTDDKGD